MRITNFRLKPWAACLISLTIGLLLGAFFTYAENRNLPIPDWVIISVLIFLVLMSIWYWKTIDETAKEAHKFSWYWGSTFGICLIAILCVVSLSGLNSMHLFAWLLPENPSADDVFFSGVYATVLTQIVCYSILWAFWWLRMR